MTEQARKKGIPWWGWMLIAAVALQAACTLVGVGFELSDMYP